jgi:hypothetical protein
MAIDDPTYPEDPTDVIPFIPTELSKDLQIIKIAKLEEELSDSNSKLGLALNAVHRMRRLLLEIRNITTHVNFDES